MTEHSIHVLSFKFFLGRHAVFINPPINNLQCYHMYFSCVTDRREAIPRFIRKPRTCTVTEGQIAKFDCKIITASPPIVTWYVLSFLNQNEGV